MKVDKYFEFVQADFEPVKSFHLKDELNPKIWTDFELDQDIREDLLRIAQSTQPVARADRDAACALPAKLLPSVESVYWSFGAQLRCVHALDYPSVPTFPSAPPRPTIPAR